MNQVIAVGALGGSGTRVVAQILKESGVYIGSDLNRAYDNLLFTRLFKNPDWYYTASDAEIDSRLQIFEKLMSGSFSLSIQEIQLLKNASDRNKLFQSDRDLKKVINSHKDRESISKVWGWKEPNTQIYIDKIASFFPNLKYVHIIRHGLDMAFSNNKQQLINWGRKYDVILSGNETDLELARKQLEYWLKSNIASIAIGQQNLGANFYLLNHQSLCKDPSGEVDKLLDFIGVNPPAHKLLELKSLPKTPESNLRYKKRDLSIFPDDTLQAVEKLGFVV